MKLKIFNWGFWQINLVIPIDRQGVGNGYYSNAKW